MFERFMRPFFTVAVILGIAGCSGGPEIPSTVSVKGTVTYKGEPIADAQVGFVSKLDNKDVFPANGITNASGEYSLSTYIDPEHEVSGATPGEYVVVVTKTEQRNIEEVMKEFKLNPNMTIKKLVPEKYADTKASPLSATVTTSGDNKFDFILED